MKPWISRLTIGGCVLLSGGLLHQRSNYLETKRERNETREALETALQKNTQQQKLINQWLESRGTSAFKGDFASDDYPSTVARVRHVSPVPDPVKSPYTECLIEIEIEPYDLDKATTGEPVVGVITAFRDRVRTPESFVTVGELIHCMLIPETHIKDEMKKLQRVSTVEDLTLDTKYLASVARLGIGKPDKVSLSTFDHVLSREESIEKDLERITHLLRIHGGTYEDWHAQTESYRDMLRARVANEGENITIDDRLTFRNLNYMESEPGALWPKAQLAMINSMKDQLAERGLDLIVVPIPSKEITNWPYFIDRHPPDDIIMPYRLHFLQMMLEADIEVIDVAPALRKAWETYPHVYYDGKDGHPADGAIQVAADQISNRLARYEFKPRLRTTWRMTLSHNIPEKFDLFPESAWNEDRYLATRVMTLGLRGVRDVSTDDAPILFASDSFGSVPYEYGMRNANLVSHITARLGVPIYHKQVNAGGPGMLRHMAADRLDLFSNRKVCVFLFSERFLFKHAPGNKKFEWTTFDLSTAGKKAPR